jgi:hypothetical protein
VAVRFTRAVRLAFGYDTILRTVGLGSPRYVFAALFGKTASRLRRCWRFLIVTAP